MILRRCGAAAPFRGERTAEHLFSATWDRRRGGSFLLDLGCLELALDLGVDLRAARVDPEEALRMAFFKECGGQGWVNAMRMEWGTPKSLLEMAILCGQPAVAERLARLGCDTGGLTSACPRASAVVGCEIIWHGRFYCCKFNGPAEPARAATHAHQVLRAEYRVQIRQLTGWWRRVPDDSGGGAVAARHAHLVELIADFASALRLLPELAAHCARPGGDRPAGDGGVP